MDACRRASVVDLRAAVMTPRGGGAYCTVVVIVCIPYLRYRRVSNTIEGRIITVTSRIYCYGARTSGRRYTSDERL